jgi:hypothetical protein
MRGVRNLIIALVFSLVMPVAAFGNGISCSDQAIKVNGDRQTRD